MGTKLLGIKAIGFDVDKTLYQVNEGLDKWIRNQLIGAVANHLQKDMAETTVLYEAKLSELGSNTLTLNSFGLEGPKVFQHLFDDIPFTSYVSRDEKLVSMIARLKAEFPLFIISNGTERQIVLKMTTLGLNMPDFDPVVSCYDHPGWTKPNPAPFLHVLDKLQLAPEQVVYVGDREETDIVAAQAVGMKAVMVGGSSTVADASVQSVYDVEQLFEK